MIDRQDSDQELNIALLIDADNASPDHLDEVLLVLGELGTINIRRAYGNWQKVSLKNWGTLTGKHSIIPVQQFDVVKGKSATDMRMTIDAMDLLYRGHVDGFGTAKTPQSFQQACSRFFDVAALADSSNGAGGSDNPIDDELLQVLGAAYKASKRDEEGYAPLSELGQRAKAVSSFAVRNYGYTRLSDLIRAVPNFEVKTGEDGRLAVKRMR
jgi:hypothetical protein